RGLCARSDPTVARNEKTPRPSRQCIRGRIRISIQPGKARLVGGREGLHDGRGASQDVPSAANRPTKALGGTRRRLEDRERKFPHGHITPIVESQGFFPGLVKARRVEKKERKSSRFAFESSDSGSSVVE